MSPSHENHLANIKAKVEADLDSRYRAGASQHGGELWKKPVLSEALAEVTDLLVYLHTLQQQMEVIRALASIGVDDQSIVASEARDSCHKILQVLHGTKK